MTKRTRILLIVGGVVLFLLILLIAAYNSVITAQETADEKRATIDTMLTRRADLIPNLVTTVKAYTKHEEEVFTELANARARLAGSSGTAEKLEANAALDNALGRLLVIVENYPELKASSQYIALQAQLEGAENRISTARADYNTAVKNYNAKIRRFPGNLLAGVFGFQTMPMYEADDTDKHVPIVEF